MGTYFTVSGGIGHLSFVICPQSPVPLVPLRADEATPNLECIQPLLEGGVVGGADGRVLKAERHQWQSG